MLKRLNVVIAVLVGLFTVSLSWAEGTEKKEKVHVKPAVNKYAFVQMGRIKLKDSQSKIITEDGEAVGEFDDLPLFTGGIQTLIGNGYFRYGYEAGALISWQNDSVSYYGTNNSVVVVVDNEFWMFGGFLGAMGEINFKDRVRLFVSAGPMIGFGSTSQNTDKDDEQPSTKTTYVNGQQREFTGIYGAYAAVGGVINFGRNTELGIVYREQVLEANFSSKIAAPEYDGRQIMISFGYKM